MLALDVYENFLKGRRRSQAVASGRRQWAPPMNSLIEYGRIHYTTHTLNKFGN